jgi:hypothetical protein
MDAGEYEYSAITFNTLSATSTSDTVEMALYSTQMINPFGLFPHQQIVSGITASTTTTGLNTYTFPTPISFSGFGGGIYFLVFKISNGGVQPTWRPGQHSNAQVVLTQSQQIYGMTQSFTPLTYNANSVRFNNTGQNYMAFSGLTTFPAQFSNTTNTSQSTSTTLTGNAPGFILHTTDY